MEILDIFDDELRSVAKTIVRKGWGEATAGNLSVNVTNYFNLNESDVMNNGVIHTLPQKYPHLAGEVLMISLSGSRMRTMIEEPASALCFIVLNEGGSRYRLIPDKPEIVSPAPTSELPSHLAVQDLLKKTGSRDKVLLHTHMTEAIALTHLPGYCSERQINRRLWEMQPEMMTFLPQGVGFVPYQMPGSEVIGTATAEQLTHHKAVLWEKHGCLTTGSTLQEALDRQEMIAKSIEILFFCLNAGVEPEGLSEYQIAELRKQALKK